MSLSSVFKIEAYRILLLVNLGRDFGIEDYYFNNLSAIILGFSFVIFQILTAHTQVLHAHMTDLQ